MKQKAEHKTKKTIQKKLPKISLHYLFEIQKGNSFSLGNINKGKNSNESIKSKSDKELNKNNGSDNLIEKGNNFENLEKKTRNKYRI